jgi:hypothetical protein
VPIIEAHATRRTGVASAGIEVSGVAVVTCSPCGSMA